MSGQQDSTSYIPKYDDPFDCEHPSAKLWFALLGGPVSGVQATEIMEAFARCVAHRDAEKIRSIKAGDLVDGTPDFGSLGPFSAARYCADLIDPEVST